MKKILQNNKGVSLPLVIGLLALLMVSTAAVNELIVKTMQSVRRIEASNRAYMAAEAGLEDALYELTPHLAGYETPDLDGSDAGTIRGSDFIGGAVDWKSEWQIEGISDTNVWSGTFDSKKKLIIALYKDYNDVNIDFTSNIPNAINTSATAIDTIKDVSGNFSITFRVPDPGTYLIWDNYWRIDNDNDLIVNEDPEIGFNFGLVGCENNTDCDGDGSINEDGPDNAVILWKLTDGSGRNLIPLRGCIEDTIFFPDPKTRSRICEIDFDKADPDPYKYAVTLDKSTYGRRENGDIEDIGKFIRDTTEGFKLQFEFIIIAPMKHVSSRTGNRITEFIEIPYLEYTVDTGNPGVDDLPLPFFRIKSDGYHGTFKQSLSTTVSPRVSVPLFDFTIIQQ